MENSDQNIDIDISPTNDFISGLHLGLSGHWGEGYDVGMTECKKKSDVTVGLCLKMDNEEKAAAAVETLNGLKEMFGGMPEVQAMLEKGIKYHFKAHGSDVNIDIHLSKEMTKMMHDETFSQFDFSAVKFFLTCALDFNTAIDPTAIFRETSDDQFKNMFTNHSVKGKIHGKDIKNVIDMITKFLLNMAEKHHQHMSSRFHALSLLLSCANSKFHFNYLPEVFVDLIQKMAGDNKPIEMLQQYCGMAQGMLPMAQQMAPMFIGPYIEALSGLNFNKFEVYAYVPKFNVKANIVLEIPGLTEFVRTNFLQQQ